MMLLTCGDVREPVLDDGKHLADGEENAAGEHVLVVDHEPSVEDVDDVWLQDLRAGQLGELLLFEHLVVLLGGGLVAE